MKFLSLFIFLFLVSSGSLLHAQPGSGGSQPVIIDSANFLYFKKLPDNSELQMLAGKVKLRQGNTIFYCDSCVINKNANLFEAFGKVHIIDNDTTHIRSDYLRYLTNTKMAYLNGNSSLSDGHSTLYTPDLEYDVNNKIGTYKNGGRLVNKKSVLTSQEGVYYTDLRDIYFRQNVELKDPAYYLKTDSLLYNTESQIARFIAQTYIRDSSNRVIRTREGYYDLANNHAEFLSRTFIEDGSMRAVADHIISDNKKNIIQMDGTALLKDSVKGYNVLADKIFVDKTNDAFLATKKPLMIIKQEKDSIFITADTLFSAKLTELFKYDTAMLKTFHFREKDSTNRYFEGFRNVRIFSDSLQAVSDSMFYTFKDSIFQLYYDPIVWNKKSQITGDTIFLYTKNKKADRIKVINNSFIVSEVEAGVYNQIKSSRIDGFFKDGTLDSVRARGKAESVYVLQDKDSAYTGTNQTASDAIDVYFDKGELYKVVFRIDLKGTLFPVSQKRPNELKLENFRWLDNRRPKSKFELYE